jgi:predicted Zn-dependent peptidase
LTDAIAALVNHPASYAMSRFMTAFCEDRQTVSPLTIEQVQALGQEQLLSLLHYIRHSACFDVFYVGQTPPEDIIRELRRCFLPILGEDEVPVRRVNVSPIAWRETRKIVNETGTAGQSHLVLGYRTPVTIVHPDFYAMMLCNEMLGGSPVSRLFLQVREMRSLCYSIGSEYVSDRGELLICCGIDRACRDQAMDSILEQITAIQQGDFEDQELESARALLLGSYRQLADNTGAITAFYSLRGLLEMNVTLDGCRTALAAVKREDVIRAACSLHPDTVYFLEGSGTEPSGDEEAEEEVSHLVG